MKIRIFKEIYYWFAYRFIDSYRYNIIDMKKTLEPRYHEIETRMVHALFTLLVNYVEKEMDIVCWDETPDDVRLKNEIDYLYNWWKNIYPNYYKKDPLYGVKSSSKEFSEKCMESFYYENETEAEIEENMIRLIKIRRVLWS